MLRKISNFFPQKLEVGCNCLKNLDIVPQYPEGYMLLAYTRSVHYFRSYEVEGNVWFTRKHELRGVPRCSAAITQRWVGRAKHF